MERFSFEELYKISYIEQQKNRKITREELEDLLDQDINREEYTSYVKMPFPLLPLIEKVDKFIRDSMYNTFINSMKSK